jgi:hypothetical protein
MGALDLKGGRGLKGEEYKPAHLYNMGQADEKEN